MRKIKGSFTLEAVIVVSSIIMILFAILYSFMIMYQYVIVTYAASYAAQQGASTWVNSALDINTGEGKYNSEVYYRIAEFAGGSLVQEKKNKIENCVKEKLSMGILSPKNSTVKVDFKNYVFQRQVHVEVKQDIPIPFSGIVKFFNGGNTFCIETKAVAVVSEPAEYIRNCDYVTELVTGLADWVGKKLGIGKNETLNKIKSAVSLVTN